EEQDRYVSEKHTQKQKNQNFTQVYPLGWKRLRELFRGNPGAAAPTTERSERVGEEAEENLKLH
ncbi:hypothetical protein ML351_25940, partial [Escherichia coli]|nr:hypothetical protein [Escherichia coli]